jgi:hypothetical protein
MRRQTASIFPPAIQAAIVPLLNTEAVVELDASTLSLIGHWQVRGNDNADPDFRSTPTLFQAQINGITTKMVGRNQGRTFYAFKRHALGSGLAGAISAKPILNLSASRSKIRSKPLRSTTHLLKLHQLGKF